MKAHIYANILRVCALSKQVFFMVLALSGKVSCLSKMAKGIQFVYSVVILSLVGA